MRMQGPSLFFVLQIEDRDAVDCTDEIAAVEGVDLLFCGTGGSQPQLRRPHAVSTSADPASERQSRERGSKDG